MIPFVVFANGVSIHSEPVVLILLFLGAFFPAPPQGFMTLLHKEISITEIMHCLFSPVWEPGCLCSEDQPGACV